MNFARAWLHAQSLVCAGLYVQAGDEPLVVLERRERLSVQQGRRHVGRSAASGPEDLGSLPDVAPGFGVIDLARPTTC
jgi:hypothetical protein